ncbi:hypothetical protein DFH08DRAFT_76086 [Mycena albidolilacea]|uniref:Uncharacterized protein n=1 Tax=Mycena albidolilacea TaxID=1033008 RepID=A0AAD6YZ84_9AGAR|nr:hypothetical protein DFH08DRAFT_76086 [Mycena albidolilacea]
MGWSPHRFPVHSGFKEGLTVWLERARNRPLSVLLEGVFDHGVFSIIWGHGQHLEICDVEGQNEVKDLWEPASPGPQLPALQTLTIRGPDDDDGFCSSHFFELLHRAPNLIECLFCNAFFHEIVESEFSGKLILPKLRRMMFGERVVSPDIGDDVLRWLSLPKLDVLSYIADKFNCQWQ